MWMQMAHKSQSIPKGGKVRFRFVAYPFPPKVYHLLIVGVKKSKRIFRKARLACHRTDTTYWRENTRSLHARRTIPPSHDFIQNQRKRVRLFAAVAIHAHGAVVNINLRLHMRRLQWSYRWNAEKRTINSKQPKQRPHRSWLVGGKRLFPSTHGDPTWHIVPHRIPATVTFPSTISRINGKGCGIHTVPWWWLSIHQLTASHETTVMDHSQWNTEKARSNDEVNFITERDNTSNTPTHPETIGKAKWPDNRYNGNESPASTL